jgi:hypothetical protein
MLFVNLKCNKFVLGYHSVGKERKECHLQRDQISESLDTNFTTSNLDTIIWELFVKLQTETISTTRIQITLDLVVEFFGNLRG